MPLMKLLNLLGTGSAIGASSTFLLAGILSLLEQL